MSNFTNRNRAFGFVLALVAIVAIFASATVAAPVKIQFDFGRTPGSITQTVSSPGSATGDFTAGDTTWNGVLETTTNYSSLKYSDGTTATGVSAQLGSVGANTPTSTIVWNDSTDLNSTPTGNAGVGIYTSNPMVQNIIFYNNNSFGSGGALGLRVNGLAPGFYGVYVTSVHPDALFRTYNIGVGLNLTQQVGSPTAISAVNNTTTTWQAGKNYAFANITVTSTGDWLSMISSNQGAFAEINGIQIVQLPEPASMASIGMLGCGLLLKRRARIA